MKIGVDGGALSADKNHQFGNYTFTINLLEAIRKYDPNNQYTFYTFAKPSSQLNLGKNIRVKIIKPKIFWSKIGMSLAQIDDKNEVFLAINQSLPIIPPKKIIGFSHGLSFYFYKNLYPDSWRKMLNQHQLLIKKCQHIIVPSKKVRDELVKIYPENYKKIKVLLYGPPFNLKSNKKVIQYKKSNYFLAVGMNHPIKNFNLLKKIFIQFKENYKEFSTKLIIINKGIELKQLKFFYQNALALLTTSLYESFNFPILEALSCGCPVISLASAVIPEMRSMVLIAKNKDEFLPLMRQVITKDIKVNNKEIKKLFSWKNYIRELKKLYD